MATMNPTDLLKQLRGNYDENLGYTGNPNSNALLSQYFSGGGTLRSLHGAMTGDNSESIIPQDMLVGALNKYYGTVQPATGNITPEQFQQATGVPFAPDSGQGSAFAPNSGLQIKAPVNAPEGYVAYRPGQDLGSGNYIIDPNNVITSHGLTYTPEANIHRHPSGDFLSHFGPALAIAATGAGILSGAGPFAGAGGLVGGASSELGAVGGASGGELSGSGLSSVLGSLGSQDLGGAELADGTATFPFGGAVAPEGIPLPAASGFDTTLASLPPSGISADVGPELSTSGFPSVLQSMTLPSGATANFVGGASPELDVVSNISDAPAISGTGSVAGGGLFGTLKDFLKDNWKSVLPMAITGANLLRGQPQLPEIAQMQGLADNAAAGQQLALDTAKNLVPTVSTGQLPPGAQQGIDNALRDAQTAIRSKYASLGLSGSTMESQELSAAQDRATAAAFNEANQLTQTGLQALGMTGNAASQYQAIMADQLQQDQELQNALAAFAAASSGGSTRPLVSLGI